MTIVVLQHSVLAQNPSNKVTLGAYYFDGWSSMSDYDHLSKGLTDTFSVRKPVWGWITSTPDIMKEQIDRAADFGLSFFCFCWYYNSGTTDFATGIVGFNRMPVNHALNLYLAAPNINRLKFCLLVTNHQGFIIGPKDWRYVCAYWLQMFSTKQYLTVDGKPLLLFYSLETLLKTFGSTEAIRSALDSLRSAARSAGFQGLTLGVCAGADKKITDAAEACGFDVLTGYNYHGDALALIKGQHEIPIGGLQRVEQMVWDRFPKLSQLKYVPVATLNWDPRPWATEKNNYSTAPYFVGFSPQSVRISVDNVIKWLSQNRDYATSSKLALLYAWNEYGEGSYLTPTADGVNMLDGVKQALIENR